jgi:hypothetical protein
MFCLGYVVFGSPMTGIGVLISVGRETHATAGLPPQRAKIARRGPRSGGRRYKSIETDDADLPETGATNLLEGGGINPAGKEKRAIR